MRWYSSESARGLRKSKPVMLGAGIIWVLIAIAERGEPEGGSLLSIGSAAGVAVMGQAPNVYTFMAHLKWGWAIALGYAASVLAHLLINARYFVTRG